MAIATSTAIALAAAAASSGATAYAAHKQSESQQSALDLARQQGGQQSALSNTLANYSKDQYALSRPALSRAIGLYSRLSGGDRNTIQSTIAPQVQQIGENYAGSQKYLEQQGVRGGVRDQAIADLNRQKTGQVGMLPMQARMGATSALASLGSQGTAQALGGLSGAAGASAGSGATYLGLAGAERAQGHDTMEFGSNLMQTLMPYLTNMRRGQGGGSAGLAGLSSQPNWENGFG